MPTQRTRNADIRVFIDGRHDRCGLPDWREQPDGYKGPTCICCAHCLAPYGH